MLGALVDPLLHVLRNAVDHGIEAPQERERLGKPAEGLLRIAFSREGDSVLVQVSDDGRGFDLDRIRSVAHARGLLAEDEERTERELLQLSVRPGFSTRETATQISGRGVGMDVVQRAVLDLKGSMDIASEDGAGATIRLRVPLTLISMHVLLVRSGGRVFGVPSGTLEQVLFSDAGVLADDGAGPVFTYEERDYRVHHLDALTGRPAAVPEAGGKALPMLLLEADAGLTAVVVEAAVDGRYLVVKSLGERVPRPPGVIGASILGDGSVAPVLDLREMLRHRSALPAAPRRPMTARRRSSATTPTWSIAGCWSWTTPSPRGACSRSGWPTRVTACAPPSTAWTRWKPSRRACRTSWSPTSRCRA